MSPVKILHFKAGVRERKKNTTLSLNEPFKGKAKQYILVLQDNTFKVNFKSKAISKNKPMDSS